MKSRKVSSILIPCTLGDTEVNKVLPLENTTYINSCSEFIVENIRSARRFLIKSNINTAINDLKKFHLLNKHTKEYELSAMLKSALKMAKILDCFQKLVALVLLTRAQIL